MGNINTLIHNLEAVPYKRLVHPRLQKIILNHIRDTRNAEAFGKYVRLTDYKPQCDIEHELLDRYKSDNRLFPSLVSLINAPYWPTTVKGMKRRLSELRRAGADISTYYQKMRKPQLTKFYTSVVRGLRSI